MGSPRCIHVSLMSLVSTFLVSYLHLPNLRHLYPLKKTPHPQTTKSLESVKNSSNTKCQVYPQKVHLLPREVCLFSRTPRCTCALYTWQKSLTSDDNDFGFLTPSLTTPFFGPTTDVSSKLSRVSRNRDFPFTTPCSFILIDFFFQTYSVLTPKESPVQRIFV